MAVIICANTLELAYAFSATLLVHPFAVSTTANVKFSGLVSEEILITGHQCSSSSIANSSMTICEPKLVLQSVQPTYLVLLSFDVVS